MPLVLDIRDLAAQQTAGTAPFYEYREVCPKSVMVQRPPLFLLGPAPADLLWQLFAESSLPPAGCYAFEGAFAAPTGFVIKDGVALFGAGLLHPLHLIGAVCDRVNTEHYPVRDVAGPLAVLFGPADETWGHWIVDYLPRLWVLQAAGYDLATLRFLVPCDQRPFAHALLECFGIGPERCVIYNQWTELIRSELLLLPMGLRRENRFSTCFAAATLWWTGKLQAACGGTIGTQRQIFLSRADASQERVMTNRAEIEAAARDAGYAVVRPEELSLAEQVTLYSGCRVLVGEYGSALHNSVFCGPDALVCGLRGTSRHPSLMQSGIATALGQDAAYVFGDTSGQDVAQRFSIEPRYFAKALELIGTKEALLF